jgi:NADH dehydrogenase [ubiquinone] 1 alpha subcomplex assembly factor 1
MPRFLLITLIIVVSTVAAMFTFLFFFSDVQASDHRVSVTTETALPGEPMTYLIDFQAPGESSRWRAINDNVMGGISRGGMRVTAGVGVFSGETSLANNGGFASVRRDPDAFDLSDAMGIALNVRGDGRRYQLRLYTGQLPEGAAYRAAFQPAADEWQRVELPWHEFEAVFRGRLLNDVSPIDPARIDQVGIMIADRNAGPFRLEVAWLDRP